MAGAWYSRPNYDHRFINKRMLMLAKPVCREKTRLTSPEVYFKQVYFKQTKNLNLPSKISNNSDFERW